MAEIEVKTKLKAQEDKLGTRYSMLSMLFLVIGLLLFIWAIVVAIGALVLKYGHNWAGLGLGSWILLIGVLLFILIILELFFYFHFSSIRAKRVQAEKPKPEYIDGKRVHVFTFPLGSEGGIFSKTYVEIDEHNILRLRTLMIPPTDLWSKK